jgi:hypothetical protein
MHPQSKLLCQLLDGNRFAGQQPHMLIDVDKDTNLFDLAQGTRRTAPRREDHHAG